MTAEAWDNQRIELTMDELLDYVVEQQQMLDQVGSLINAYRRTGDERLLDILLAMIGEEGEEEEGEGEEDE